MDLLAMAEISRTQNTALPDSGVSEVIGAILLISVVIAAVAMVSMVLFSQATPQEVPDVNFMTGTDNSNNLYLFHNGGDSLTQGTFSVLVDGVVQNYVIVGGGTSWSLGQNLLITGIPSGRQHSVAIVYNTSGRGGFVIRSGTANNITSANPVNNVDVIASSAYPPVISVPQLMQNLSSSSIVYYRQRNTTITQSPNTYLKFTITQPNSTIFTTPVCSGSNPLLLNVGDTVTITQTNSVSQGFKISGIGSQIWELAADSVSLNITTSAGVNRCTVVPLPCVINHTIITGYNNFQSNFSFATANPQGIYSTALTVYNYTTNMTPQLSSQLINRLDANTTTITNISPTSAGFFIFQFDNATRGTYFSGNTTLVTVSSNKVYPP